MKNVKKTLKTRLFFIKKWKKTRL